MKTHLKKLNLPQNLSDLTSIDTENISISQWSGAVIFLFVQDHLFLIKRSETMASHKGQLAFIGGHKKKDEEDPIVTAKREFEEETGFNSDLLDILGLSLPVRTTSQSIIVPVVSYVDMELDAFLKNVESNGEWTDGILASVDDLTNWDHWVKGQAFSDNFKTHNVLFFPIASMTHMTKNVDSDVNHLLWGATARMIWKFFKNYY